MLSPKVVDKYVNCILQDDSYSHSDITKLLSINPNIFNVNYEELNLPYYVIDIDEELPDEGDDGSFRFRVLVPCVGVYETLSTYITPNGYYLKYFNPKEYYYRESFPRFFYRGE